MSVHGKILLVFREQGTGNREQGAANRGQRTEHRAWERILDNSEINNDFSLSDTHGLY